MEKNKNKQKEAVFGSINLLIITFPKGRKKQLWQKNGKRTVELAEGHGALYLEEGGKETICPTE